MPLQIGSIVSLRSSAPLGQPRYLDGRTEDHAVQLAPTTVAQPYSGTCWAIEDGTDGAIVLQCLGDLPGNTYLDGNTTVDPGTVGLAPNTGSDFNGTRWQVEDVAGGGLNLKCLGVFAGPRYLSRSGDPAQPPICLVDSPGADAVWWPEPLRQDQVQAEGNAWAQGGSDVWQSFHAGLTGYMGRLDVKVLSDNSRDARSGTLQIYAGRGIDSPPLTAAVPITVPASCPGPFVFTAFNLAQMVYVVAGQPYTFRITTYPHTVGYPSALEDVYPGYPSGGLPASRGKVVSGAQILSFRTWVTQDD